MEPLDDERLQGRRKYLLKSATVLMENFQEVGMEGYILLVDTKANDTNYYSGGTTVGKQYLESTGGRSQSAFNLFVLKGLEDSVTSTAQLPSNGLKVVGAPKPSNCLRNSVKAQLNELYASFISKPGKAFAYADFSRQNFAALGMPSEIVSKLRKSNNLSVLGSSDLEKLDVLLKKKGIILVAGNASTSSDSAPAPTNIGDEFFVNIQQGGNGNILVVPNHSAANFPFPHAKTGASVDIKNDHRELPETEFVGAGMAAGSEDDSETVSNIAKKQVTSQDNDLPDGHYIVENILAKRVKGGVVEGLVSWKGYDKSSNTWEPMDGLPEEMVAKFNNTTFRLKAN